MLTNKERTDELHKRVARIRAERKRRTAYISAAAGAAVSLALVIAVAAVMPGIAGNIDVTPTVGMSASILADGGVLGYVIVGLIAFLLGISFTIFCVKLKKWQSEEKELKREDSDDRDDL